MPVRFTMLAAVAVIGLASIVHAAELHIGAASTSITPDKPVMLAGQLYTRISKAVESVCTANVLALESRDGDKVLDQAVMVSCDLVAIRGGATDKVRDRLRQRIPAFDPRKLFLNATHTHTAPTMEDGRYFVPPDTDYMNGEDYTAFFVDRVTDAIVKAWEARKPGAVAWGLGQAVVAYNRRIVYADGHAQMYGPTNKPDFRAIEGYEDHGLEVLFFYDAQKKLIATAVNVACPSQAVESKPTINADFWHQVRTKLRAKYGDDLVVLGWTGAAGDQSPRPMFRKAAEERMMKLRGVDRLEELASRIVAGWEDALDGARHDIRADVSLIHTVNEIDLLPRLVTEAEYAEAKAEVAKYSKNPADQARMLWHQRAIDGYEQQKAGVEPYHMELHTLRLGDVAIATNDFELFTAFGVQIKARSPAIQTFLIQLAGGGSYVPTTLAVHGGSYSAIIQSNRVGPEGGQQLVEHTLKAIEELWPKK